MEVGAYVMKVVLASMDHLQTLLDRLVPWGSPVTTIVISSPAPGRGIQRGSSPNSCSQIKPSGS